MTWAGPRETELNVEVWECAVPAKSFLNIDSAQIQNCLPLIALGTGQNKDHFQLFVPMNRDTPASYLWGSTWTPRLDMVILNWGHLRFNRCKKLFQSFLSSKAETSRSEAATHIPSLGEFYWPERKDGDLWAWIHRITNFPTSCLSS